MVFMEVFDDVEAQVQTVSDLTATLAMFDGAVEASLAAGEKLHRDLANLRSDYAALEETRRLELMAKQREDEEYTKLEKRCTAMEARIESAVKEKTIVEEKLAFEKSERMRVTEQWSAAELRHEVEVSERRRAEEKFAELEEERRHELKTVDEKHRSELRNFEKKCEELEKRNGELEAERSRKAEKCVEIWEEHKSKLLKVVNEAESKHKNLEKEYEQLLEKHDFDLIEKIRIEEERKEAVGKYQIQVTERGKAEEKCKQLAEKLERDKAEMIRTEKECREMAEKYRLEAMNCRKLKEENEVLEKKYTDALMEILKEHSELHEKHKFEEQEKLKLKRECEGLKEKMERLLRVDRADEMFVPDRKYGELHEKYEYARLENLKLRDELKELTESRKLEQRAKLKAENELSEFQILMKGFKKDLFGNFVRNDTLLKEARNGRKAKNVGTQLPMPAREASPGNGGFHVSGAPELSSGGLILLSDSDDDCAVGENKQKGLKRKHVSSSTANNNVHAKIFKQDTTPTVEMKQHQKLRRCDHSAVNSV